MAKITSSPALYDGMKRFVASQGLIRRGSRVAAAVSGGVDSVVLLDLLSRLSDEWNLTLAVLHVNHQLRGKEADADERFVRSLAARYRLPFYTLRTMTKDNAAAKKVSIQEAARNLRYSFFQKMKKDLSAEMIATAHNANDNAETVFLNLIRGTGIDGVAGIPVRRENESIVRPLLFAERKDIAAYARERKLKYREDSSNRSDKYSRNFLRHRVIPLIENRVNPSFVKTLSQTSAVLRNCAAYLADQVHNASAAIVRTKGDDVLFDKRGLKKQHPYIRQMIVHGVLLGKSVEPSFERVESILSLLDSEKGARVHCGGGWTAENESRRILLTRAEKSSFAYELEMDGTVADGTFVLSATKCARIPNKLGTSSSIEYVDARSVRFPLLVRSWREGDSFVPLGMKHRKKVSDLFVDLKVPRSQKHRIPIVESMGRIIWVAGVRLDDRCRITQSTTEAYRLSITRP